MRSGNGLRGGLVGLAVISEDHRLLVSRDTGDGLQVGGGGGDLGCRGGGELLRRLSVGAEPGAQADDRLLQRAGGGGVGGGEQRAAPRGDIAAGRRDACSSDPCGFCQPSLPVAQPIEIGCFSFCLERAHTPDRLAGISYQNSEQKNGDKSMVRA